MSVVAVRNVKIVAHKKDRDALMTALQDAGVLHISVLNTKACDQANQEAIHEISLKLLETIKAINFLRKFLGSPTAIPEKVIDGETLLARSTSLRLHYEQCTKTIETLKNQLEFYGHFGEFAISPSILEASSIYVRFAKLTEDEMSVLKEATWAYKIAAQVNQYYYVVLISCQKISYPFATKESPNQPLTRLKERLREETTRLVKLDKEASRLAYQIRILETLHETTLITHDRLQESKKMCERDDLIGLSGFVLYHAISELKKALSGKLVGLIITEPTVDQDIPVELSNPKAFKGFESILRAFSGINYFEKDKTVIISLLFMFFGALCLLDAGYGFLLMVGGYILAIKKNRDFGQVFIGTGAITMILGILCGQVFGLVFAKDIMLNIPPLLTLATDPMVCFTFSLVVGVVVMGLSNMVAIYQNGPKTHAVGCLLLVGAAITLMLKKSGLLLGQFSDPSALLNNIAIGFLCLGILSWIVFPDPVFGQKHRVANVLWMLYSGPIGLVQDILSHMRLFGIALSGSILALVINKISLLLPIFLGAIFAPLGHFLVFLLSLLSLYIHSNRLIFLEFGSKCIHGGHRYFKPFARRIWS